MLTIRCKNCKKKIFKYNKIGEGRVLRCWFDRIVKDYSIHDGNKVRCECGNLIGIIEGKRIKMKQNAFEHSGTKIRK